MNFDLTYDEFSFGFDLKMERSSECHIESSESKSSLSLDLLLLFRGNTIREYFRQKGSLIIHPHFVGKILLCLFVLRTVFSHVIYNEKVEKISYHMSYHILII